MYAFNMAIVIQNAHDSITAPVKRWKVIDENGNDVMTADDVEAAAKRERTTPRAIAKREAKNMVNVAAGDAPVFAVKA